MRLFRKRGIRIICGKNESNERAIFGFSDEEEGIKLSEFYMKHTGKYLDFNAIKHYESGFKLLLFKLPLGEVSIIDICSANIVDAQKFHGPVEEFITWYEEVYLTGTKD